MSVCNLPRRNRRLQIPSAPAELELIVHMTSEVNAVEFSLPERCRRPANCISHLDSEALSLPGIFGFSACDGRRVAALSPQVPPLTSSEWLPESAQHATACRATRQDLEVESGSKHAMCVLHRVAAPCAPRTGASMASAPGSADIYCFRGNHAHAITACGGP